MLSILLLYLVRYRACRSFQTTWLGLSPMYVVQTFSMLCWLILSMPRNPGRAPPLLQVCPWPPAFSALGLGFERQGRCAAVACHVGRIWGLKGDALTHLANQHKQDCLHLVSLQSCLTLHKGRRPVSSKHVCLAASQVLDTHTWHMNTGGDEAEDKQADCRPQKLHCSDCCMGRDCMGEAASSQPHPHVSLRHMQVWLQEWAWTESGKQRDLEKRNKGDGSPEMDGSALESEPM